MRKHTIYKSKEGEQIIARFYERYLDTFEADFERVYIQTSFGMTHVLITGPKEGKPLFIFQGGNCINPMTLSWFTPLFKHYRIYAPDTIGHPGFSEEIRISAKDQSFAVWISELMENLYVDKAAFLGPSYGAGITLRAAAFIPEKIACSILVSPAGIQLGSKVEMIKRVMIPLSLYKLKNSKKHLNEITNILSDHSMKEIDQEIIGSIFTYVKLEHEMPRRTKKKELLNYTSPTMIIAGSKDIFFPERKIKKASHEIIPNLTHFETCDMGHFPSEKHLEQINQKIEEFLRKHY